MVPGVRRAQDAALILALACLIEAMTIVVFAKHTIDDQAVQFLNHFAILAARPNAVMFALTQLNLLQGAVLVAGVWYVWFDAPDPRTRASVAAGVIATGVAALTSRGLQLLLAIHTRPLYDGALLLAQPYGSVPETAHIWRHSFPSDHAALLCGLAMVIAAVRPRLGLAAIAWALIVSLARVYEGLHFLSDVLGGAGLGMALVRASQLPAIRAHCVIIVDWATRRSALFYAGAFVASFSVATLFDDIRSIGSGLATMLH